MDLREQVDRITRKVNTDHERFKVLKVYLDEGHRLFSLILKKMDQRSHIDRIGQGEKAEEVMNELNHYLSLSGSNQLTMDKLQQAWKQEDSSNNESI